MTKEVKGFKMNETLQLIKNRQSIRQFKTIQISDAELRAIMESAIYAPNAMNEQQWHFTVIQNKGVLDKIISITKENMRNSGIEFLAARARTPEFTPFHQAPTVIFISAKDDTRDALISCALAAQNIILAAASLNIGSNIQTSPGYLFTSTKGKDLGKELGIPAGYNYVCNINLGYPDGPKPYAQPRSKGVITYVK
jgi:nitroreductase